MKQSGAPKRRTYDPQRTRGRILDVASAQFQTRGYHATSMHDIMRLASVPGGSMYHYFPTKKSLGIAVIEERVSAILAETWIEPIRSASTTCEGILTVFESVARDIERGGRPPTGCPLNNLALELSLVAPDFQIALRGVFDAWGDAVGQRLHADVQDGTVGDIDARALATVIVASFSGAMSLAKATQTVEPIRTCGRELVRLMSGSRSALSLRARLAP